MSERPVFQVDAFTNKKYGGNPAAICPLNAWLSDEEMQAIASEMNLSETAFIKPRGDGVYDLRWMTPTIEVDLCGHATLAAAHVLWTELGEETGGGINFHTRSGVLSATQRDGAIALDFPAAPATSAEPPDAMCQALGVSSYRFAGYNGMDWLLVVDGEPAVRSLAPDFGRLKAMDCRGVIVSATASGGDYDYVSRFFAPGAGIDEDPVTGSAHCCLAPYWSARLERAELVGFQASTRGGIVRTRVDGDRVQLSGHAVTILRGVLL